MGDSIAFIIPSVIYSASGPLSYTPVRSVYSPEERALQTKDGIKSVRLKVPGSKIILVELGLKKTLPYGLDTIADEYIYAGENKAVRRIVDGPNKGHGEAVALLLTDGPSKKFGPRYFFKLSGRYKLNDRFNLNGWFSVKDGLAAKKYSNSCVSTRLYGFHADFYPEWRSGIIRAIPDLRFGWAFEDTLPKFVKKIVHMETLGVSGHIAPFGTGIVE